MPVEKAKEVLTAYKEKNYNAKEALTSVGYSSITADKQSGRTIDTAVNTLVRSGDHDAILKFVGMSSGDISREYKSVITQNKNYPAKLRALEPLLKLNGIKWDDEKTQITPQVNITMNKKDDSPAQISDINASIGLNKAISSSNVVQYPFCDTENKKVEVRFDSENKKEGSCPTPNIDEKVGLDINENILQNENEEDIPQSFKS